MRLVALCRGNERVREILDVGREDGNMEQAITGSVVIQFSFLSGPAKDADSFVFLEADKR